VSNTPRTEVTKLDGKIWRDKDRLLFEPNIYPSTQVKTIGFRWAQDGSNSWEAPLRLSAYEKLIEMFPNHVTDTSVVNWLDELNKPVELSDNILQSDLMAFQREAVAFMLKTERGMLGLAPGLGKTPVSIKALQEVGGRTLIVCPLSLVYNWVREILKWADEDCEIWHGWSGESETNWVITNYETVLNYMVRYDIKTVQKNGKPKKTKVNWRPIRQFPFNNIIIDESILVKNRKAQRSKAIYTIANKLTAVKRVYLLSGSPISKFLVDIWHQFHIIDRKRFPSYWKFAHNYCVVEKNFWGTQITSDQPEAINKLKYENRDIYFARTQDQVLNLPDWIFDILEIPMDPQQTKLYHQMQTDIIRCKLTLSPRYPKVIRSLHRTYFRK
jgi:SNF2 family DNA or RNA helicase